MLGRALAAVLEPRHAVSGAGCREADITDAAAIAQVIEAARPEAVVHAAAFTSVDDCESLPELAFRVNTEGTRNVALACRQQGVPMMCISTDYVFDGKKSEPYIEEDEPRPLNVYGRSKLQGEEEVRKLLERWWIVRVCGLFGPHRKNFVSLVAEQGHEGRPLRIVKDQWLSPTYTFDAALAIEQILGRGPSGIYHLTNQGFVSRPDFAREILRTAGCPNVPVTPITSAQAGRAAPRPRNSRLENARMKREGLALLPPWPDAVRRYLLQLAEEKK